MITVEYCLGNTSVARDENGLSIKESLVCDNDPPTHYDLDLIYAECQNCGSPLIWEKGKTSLLIRRSGIDTKLIDAECMILSEGCSKCRPETALFHLHLVRVATFTAHDVILLSADNIKNA